MLDDTRSKDAIETTTHAHLKAKMSRPKKTPRKQTMADRADVHLLYEKSVQMPSHEVAFFDKAYRDANGDQPLRLREDFCGTFAVSSQWVQSDSRRTAIGVDTCSETLDWGRQHHLSSLTKNQQRRITLKHQDVREPTDGFVDVLAVQNFSFWVLKTRHLVLEYFRCALSRLTDAGIMVIDMMGGSECRTEGLSHRQTIERGKDGFSYQWTQVSFNPIRSEACYSISFHFPDGSRLKDAFVYRWRLWTLPEVREMLEEAGFRETHVYWAIDEGIDRPLGEGWQRCEVASSDASWTCYLVALKSPSRS